MQTTRDREPRGIGIVEHRHLAHHVFAAQQFRIDAVQAHNVAAARQVVHLAWAMTEIDNAAMRDHGIKVQVVRQALPQFQRKLIELRIRIQQIVGSDDRGIAAHVAGRRANPFRARPRS